MKTFRILSKRLLNCNFKYDIKISDFEYAEVTSDQYSNSAKTRTRLDLDQKLKLIEDSMKPGFNISKAARQYGLSRSGIYSILKNKFAIYCHPSIEKREKSKIKKLSWNPNAQLESALFDWYQARVQQDLPVSGLMIKTKAKELSNSYAISSSSDNNIIKFSDGWLDGFKKRHGIKLSNREPQSRKKENSSTNSTTSDNSDNNLSLVKSE